MALILSRADLQRCLDMSTAIKAMQVAFRALHAGQVQMPQRLSVDLSDQGLALLMPSLLQTPERPAFGLKLLTSVSDNATRGLPRSLATVLLLDATSGQTLAIIEGSWLTAVRTGAVSGLATQLLARLSRALRRPPKPCPALCWWPAQQSQPSHSFVYKTSRPARISTRSALLHPKCARLIQRRWRVRGLW